MQNRLRRFVRLWIDLFARHELLDKASAIAFQVLKSPKFCSCSSG